MNSPLRRFKAEIFRALAHPTRIAILELLHDKEVSAGSLIETLGVEQANLSQHLAILRNKNLVNQRRSGTQIFYSIRDPIITQVLQLMRSHFNAHLKESRATLNDLEQESRKTDPKLRKRSSG